MFRFFLLHLSFLCRFSCAVEHFCCCCCWLSRSTVEINEPSERRRKSDTVKVSLVDIWQLSSCCCCVMGVVAAVMIQFLSWWQFGGSFVGCFLFLFQRTIWEKMWERISLFLWQLIDIDVTFDPDRGTWMFAGPMSSTAKLNYNCWVHLTPCPFSFDLLPFKLNTGTPNNLKTLIHKLLVVLLIELSLACHGIIDTSSGFWWWWCSDC